MGAELIANNNCASTCQVRWPTRPALYISRGPVWLHVFVGISRPLSKACDDLQLLYYRTVQVPSRYSMLHWIITHVNLYDL